jgi:RNA polymerase primary sigma factor
MRQFKISDRLTPRITKASSSYLNDVEKTRPLDPEVEAELAWRASNGDIEARDIIVRSNLRFVLSVAKMYSRSPEDFADLVSAGNIGLVEAASKFDPSRGFKFISYAVWHIRKEMLVHLNENGRTVRLPINQISNIKKIMETSNKLSTELGREATFDESFEFIKESDPKYRSLRIDTVKKAMIADIRPASFNAPIKSDSTDTMLDIFDGGYESTDHNMEVQGVREMLENLANELPDQLKEIVMRRHGIPDYADEEETFQEIAKVVGISSEMVRVKYKKALKMMKSLARKHNYKAYMDVF